MKNKFKIKVFFNRQNILLLKIHHGLNQIKLSRMCYKLPFIENKQKVFHYYFYQQSEFYQYNKLNSIY